MAGNYMLARALQEFDTGIAVPDNEQPLQPYLDLAWAGLQHTPIYNSTDLINEADRERINKRYAAELLNMTVGTNEKIGQSCD